MMGRPVIVRNIPGLTEFVTRGQNGLVLEDPITAESVAGAVRTIQDDFQAFSAAARAAYLAQFSPKILHQALLTPILAALGQRDTDGE
jgi:glycosyltransferase involved in cell wall biosynthesis